MMIPFYPIAEQFRESFCKMDIAKINLALEIDKKFCKVSKTEFVASLTRLFSYLKVLGEDSFDCYTAQCISEVCCNADKDVFIFASKNLKYYLTLMIEADAERIYQISECYNYNFDSSKLNVPLVLKDFVTPDWKEHIYDINVEKIKELYPTDSYIPSYSEFEFWSAKMNRSPRSRSDAHLQTDILLSFFQHISFFFFRKCYVNTAVEQIEKLNTQDEAAVILWVIYNEKLGCDTSIFEVPFDIDTSKKFIYNIINNEPYCFDLSELSNFPSFGENFRSMYDPLYVKFNIEKYELMFQSEPLKGRLERLGIIEMTEEYNHDNDCDEYRVDLEKLARFNSAYKKK